VPFGIRARRAARPLRWLQQVREREAQVVVPVEVLPPNAGGLRRDLAGEVEHVPDVHLVIPLHTGPRRQRARDRGCVDSGSARSRGPVATVEWASPVQYLDALYPRDPPWKGPTRGQNGIQAVDSTSQLAETPNKMLESPCKPGSVPRPLGHGGEHSSRRRVAAPLQRAVPGGFGRAALSTRNLAAPVTPPYLLLHQVGFAVPLRLPGARCALAAPFHPCHAPP